MQLIPGVSQFEKSDAGCSSSRELLTVKPVNEYYAMETISDIDIKIIVTVNNSQQMAI